MAASLDFWFEFASTYSYLSVLRIEDDARKSGVAVRWRPFLLGPIFAAQGWSTSPFNIYEVKGRYMVRDIERSAAARGLRFTLPKPFPQHSLMAARVCLTVPDAGARARFVREVMMAQFAEGQQINDAGVLSACLTRTGLQPEMHLQTAQSEAIKSELKSNTDEARALGVFGAPSFVTADRELFWGDDRLDAALAWAKRAA